MPEIVKTVATDDKGIDEVLAAIEAFRGRAEESGAARAEAARPPAPAVRGDAARAGPAPARRARPGRRRARADPGSPGRARDRPLHGHGRGAEEGGAVKHPEDRPPRDSGEGPRGSGPRLRGARVCRRSDATTCRPRRSARPSCPSGEIAPRAAGAHRSLVRDRALPGEALRAPPRLRARGGHRRRPGRAQGARRAPPGRDSARRARAGAGSRSCIRGAPPASSWS